MRMHVRSWHFSDVTAGLRSVCCWGKSGRRDCVADFRVGPETDILFLCNFAKVLLPVDMH